MKSESGRAELIEPPAQASLEAGGRGNTDFHHHTKRGHKEAVRSLCQASVFGSLPHGRRDGLYLPACCKYRGFGRLANDPTSLYIETALSKGVCYTACYTGIHAAFTRFVYKACGLKARGFYMKTTKLKLGPNTMCS